MAQIHRIATSKCDRQRQQLPTLAEVVTSRTHSILRDQMNTERLTRFYQAIEAAGLITRASPGSIISAKIIAARIVAEGMA